MEIRKCCLTGLDLNLEDIQPTISTNLQYYTRITGLVRVSQPTYIEMLNADGKAFPYYELIGICRNAHENNQEPPILTSEYIREGYKQMNIPKSFDQKVRHLLNYIYSHGGNENKSFRFDSIIDFPLAYSDPEEFDRIMDWLKKNYLIDTSQVQFRPGGRKTYGHVIMTPLGGSEAEKDLPQIPMIGLVDQEIETGDPTVDAKIMHAKTLFFKNNSTMDDKRSACETLSYVLEPLRDSLNYFFSKSDVNDFFQLVNRFDIRHNKDNTINLIHEEQLEWVFYTLLNTISTFVKLKVKSLNYSTL